MLNLFTKPLESLTAVDASSVVGWPESLTAEFKRELPSREGRGDNWLRGGRVEQYAKDGIFKEVVAFANTLGGHVVLGVAETKDKPPVAEQIVPISRCLDLAEALERAAQAIDPPIPLLGVRGVPTCDDGSGIVVFRVPQSRVALHRAPDKDCYVRRGTESTPMTMREIQDMTFAVGHRSEFLRERFQRSREELRAWFERPVRGGEIAKVTGFRITAVPAVGSFSLPRLYGTLTDFKLIEQVRVAAVLPGHRSEFTLFAPHLPDQTQPILRGIRMTDFDGYIRLNLHSDGTVEVGAGFDSIRGEAQLYIGWIAAYAINVLRSVDYLRTRAGAPDAEYAVEFEVLTRASPLTLLGWGQNPSMNPIGPLSSWPVVLPRTSFGPIAEIGSVITQLGSDLYDEIGGRYTDLPHIELV